MENRQNERIGPTTLIVCAIVLGTFYLLGKGKEPMPQYSMVGLGSSGVAVMNNATGDVAVIVPKDGQLLRVFEPGKAPKFGADDQVVGR